MPDPNDPEPRRGTLTDGAPPSEEHAHSMATPRVVLLATALGLVAVLGVGGAIAISTTANLGGTGGGTVQAGPDGSPADGEASPGRERPRAPGSASGPHSSAGAGAVGTTPPEASAAPGDGEPSEEPGSGDPVIGSEVVYDAASDLADVPLPPADWTDAERAEAERWLQQQGVIADCMLDRGFDYDFLPYWLGGADDGQPPGMAVREDRAWVEALDGEAGHGRGRSGEHAASGRDWRERGCRGYAEHVVG